jgi:hypothetical protein
MLSTDAATFSEISNLPANRNGIFCRNKHDFGGDFQY